MAFEVPQPVLFKHCDPAGIVFYPRYFEMMNDAVEAFFTHGLGIDFAVLHRDGGVPTARIEITFTAPSRHGDHLLIALTPTRLGGASLDLAFEARAGEERRFHATSTLVLVGPDGRPRPWSADQRDRITPFLEETE